MAGMLFFSSCPPGKKHGGDEVDIQYKLTASIRTLDVVKELRDLDGSELFPDGVIDDGSHVRVKFFIYDDQGKLLEENTQIVDDFSQKVEIVKSLYPGEYTLVTTADMVENTGDKIEFECWKFEYTSSLEDFKITDLQYKGYEYKAIGVDKTTISIQKAESTDIRVRPIGALITFYFNNLDVKKMAYLAYSWNKSSDYYRPDNGKSSVIDSGDENEYEVKEQYQGFYDQRYFLPVQSLKFSWATYNASTTILKSGSVTCNVQEAVNQTITVNAQTGEAQVQTKASISLDDIERSRKAETSSKR